MQQRMRGTIPSEITKATVTLYMIMSDIGDRIYGPFVSRDDAFDLAEQSDASVFECTARLVSVREI
jgi:hypothetical protein